jgi:hypothetical protein
MREGLIDIVQAEAYAPLHVRAGNPGRTLRLVGADAEPATGERADGSEASARAGAATAGADAQAPPTDEEPS